MFTASPPEITRGETSTLRWSTSLADSLSIDQGVGSVTPLHAGNVSVAPTATTTYTLTASNLSGRATSSATITVNPPPDPVIDSFTADPTTITAGESTTLTWGTTNATSVSIPGTSGSLDVDGSTSVSPTTTTIYTLTAAGASGTTAVASTVTITVKPPGPVIDSFTAASTTIAAGGSTTLTWTTTGATSVSITGISGALAVDGSQSVSPAAATTYTLTASDDNDATDDTTATVTVIVTGRPTASLTAAPTAITAGESAELRWTTIGATSASIDQGVGAITPVEGGSVSVSPTTTTTYTLTASDSSGDSTAVITVTVSQPDPVIDSFSATSTTISAGESTTLTWETTNATSVTIPGTSGVLDVDGSTSVSPTSTTVYTLTAAGASGTTAATATVTVTVNPADPVIDSFTADSNSIASGGSTTLRWQTTHATAVTISGVTETLAVDGSVSVSPSTHTTYKLTAAGASGTTAATATVTITITGWPSATLTADPTAITAGESSMLRWTTSNATVVSIDQGVGAVTPQAGGSVSVSPTSPTTYTLIASNDNDPTDDAIATATVTVRPPEPVIDSFAADSASITEGGSTTLRWQTTHATAVTISGVTETLAVDGSVSVSPSAHTTYTLTAAGASGTTAATATIIITIASHATATLTANPTTITLGQSATLRWASSAATSASIDQGVGAVTPLHAGSESVSPTATTTYTLTVQGPSGTPAANASARVSVKPRIDSFRASSNSITEGNTTTLRWSTTGATSVSISGISGPLAVDGSRSVSPTSTTTYTLTATNASGSSTKSVRVTVRPPPPPPCRIDSFRASSTLTTAGDSTTLRWSTTSATGTSINQGVGSVTPVASGSRSVSPISTTTYTLTASCLGSSNKTATVTVRVKPRIDSFRANPSTITRGDTSTLSWSTTSATSISISGISGSWSGDDSQTVAPLTTKTYTLTARNAAGSNTATVTINVKPKINTFSANPATITLGDPTTLSWTTAGATSTSINQSVGSVTPVTSGSKSVKPSTTPTASYTLTATNAAGSNTKSVTVNVKPRIDSFSATSTSITEGNPTTLRWSTTGATSVTISAISGTLSVDGSRSVSPTSTTTYTLTARNAAGSNTATVKIAVTPRPPTASLEAAPTEFFGLTDPVTLYWSTTRATSAEIDQGVGSVTPVAAGSVTVYPESTTTYTLTATGPGGSATASVEVLNVDSQRVLTATLTAKPLSITRGGSTTLSWTTEGADSAEIDQGVGSVTPVASGSTSVSPTATTTYTLTATSGEGDDAVSVTATVEVTVTQPDPTIDSFSVDDATPETGETVTLSWTTSHAGSAVLRRQSGDTWESVGAVELNGSHSVSRDSAGSESYQLLIRRDNRAELSVPITITWSDPSDD